MYANVDSEFGLAGFKFKHLFKTPLKLTGKVGKEIKRSLEKQGAFVAGVVTVGLVKQKVFGIKASNKKYFKAGKVGAIVVGGVVGAAVLAPYAAAAMASASSSIGAGGIAATSAATTGATTAATTAAATKMTVWGAAKWVGGKLLTMGPLATQMLGKQGIAPQEATPNQVMIATLEANEIQESQVRAYATAKKKKNMKTLGIAGVALLAYTQFK